MDKQIIINDLLISYNETGKSGGACLLFLHGWRSQKEAWNDLELRIKDYGLRMVSLDLPGFGKSQTPEQATSIGDYAETIKEFIEKLGLKNVIIVGHSFGGRVGIKLAAKYPALIDKLVLVDSAGFAMNSTKKTAMNIGAKIVKPFFKPKFMQGLRNRIYQSIGAEDYVQKPELQKTFVKTISEDLTEDMKRIKCPTLIINGQNDLDTPIEFGERMHSFIPNSQFKILADAGHFSFLDKPEEFVTLISEFMEL